MYSSVNGTGRIIIYKGEKPTDKNKILEEDFNVLDGDVKSYEEAKKVATKLSEKVLEKVKYGTMITVVINRYCAMYTIGSDFIEMLISDFLDS